MKLQLLIFATMVAFIYGVPVAPVYAPAPVTYTAHHAPAPVAYAQPVAYAAKPVEEYDPNPQYSYAYDIQDHLTGDSKSHQESRNGDTVQGSYSLVDPDGVKRTVEYTADPHNGFNAVVHREPLGKAIVAQPIAKAYAAAAAPVPAYAKVGYAQPLLGHQTYVHH